MENEYIVEMRSIQKRFPGVLALNNVDLFVKKGEVHGVVGENGAGKSTLMKILDGVYTKDAGEIKLNGEVVTIKDPLDARNRGIGLVHQEPQIVPCLSIAENICLGSLPRGKTFIDSGKLFVESERLCREVGIDKPVAMLASALSMGERQLLQFARALFYQSTLIIMDEPTSSLTEQEKNHIFNIVRKLKANGISFVYITHRMEELFEICDRITVLKDGEFVKCLNITDADKKGIVNLMVGRELGLKFPDSKETFGEEILRAENLTKTGLFKDINFSVRAGEVVGFGGLIGAGRTEVMDAIFGMNPADSGEIYIKNKKVRITSPKDAIAHQIAYVTEDRHGGMVLHMSIFENITLASLKKFVGKILINNKKRRQAAEDYLRKLSIKAPGIVTPVNSLSGGNQQKVIFGKWLMQSADLYILDEPTRGIDVGAKEEIYKLIRDLTDAGKGVIVISSELPELLGISDRILVMHNGAISGEVLHNEATESKVLHYATGVANL